MNLDLSLNEYFEILSKTIVDRTGHGRHDAIREFTFDEEVLLGKKKWNNIRKTRNACVCYCIWDNFAYVKYAYLSILSAHLYTDIRKFPIILLVDSSLEPHVRRVKEIFETLDVKIYFRDWGRFKYSIPTFFNKFDFVVNVDADVFFYGNKNSIFQTLYNYWRYVKQTKTMKMPFMVYGKELDFNTKQRFELVYRAIDASLVDVNEDNLEEDWKAFWKNYDPIDINGYELERWMNNEWIWNLITAYDVDLFDTDQWREHQKYCKSELELWDDEFVYQLYLWKNNIPVKYLSNFKNINTVHPYQYSNGVERDIHSLDVVDYDAPESAPTSIIHPINSYNSYPKDRVASFFAHIEGKFKSIYIKG